MNDPYQVLGVGRDVSDDELKRAYRDLARKYHPDNYANNPLADLAQEKMKEINEAYDQIMKERQGGGSSYSGGTYSSSGSYSSYAGTGDYADIRRMITAGNISGAEARLQAMTQRDAEWYFLMGSVYSRKGWFDEARRHIETACSMNPSNAEYRNALAQLSNINTTYRNYGGGAMSGTDCCTSLLCANLCCNCMGGGC